MSKLANRRSPSGPKSSIQLPYYGTQPVTATTVYATVGEPDSSATEPDTQYRVPANGKLDTLLVQNNPVGADAVSATYQARKNGANVGSPVVIANNAAGPVKVDLSSINVVEGDLLSISITTPAFAGAAPSARLLFSWSPATSS